MPRLLAGAAGGALGPAERHRLRRHLARCVPCRAAQNAQREAERAYAHPPAPPLPPITRQAVIAALRHAIPPAAPPPAPPAPAAPAPAGLAPKPSEPAPPVASDPVRSPEHGFAGPSGDPSQPGPGLGPARVPPAPPTPPPAPRQAMPGPGSHVSGSPEPSGEAATGVIPVDQVAAALGYAAHPAGAPPPPDPAPAPRRLALPRLAATAIARLPRARVFAPVAVLLAALLVILAIAGVFGGGSHSPAPGPASSAAPPAV
ncbi:MAG: zf-HC2 domain-containing protein, partial [Actinobacteria bacterium]|nr:zf-HC2 domain-containing protein [Actinomycetota bacterium]